MNNYQYLLIATVFALFLLQSIRCHRPETNNIITAGIIATNRTHRSSNVLKQTDSDDDLNNSESTSRLDRNLAIACTNRYNCERTCTRAKVAKQATKASLIDALTRNIGESTLTDAHKLGIQFGRHKSCEKCALIYSNCMDEWYRIARRQLFNWRHDDTTSMFADDDNRPISSYKSTNRL